MNKRVALDYKVKHFSSNRLTIEVNNPTDETVWMLYSDVWHPSWRVKVNGKDKTVYKANLAYKAVEINAGFNEIKFEIDLFHGS